MANPGPLPGPYFEFYLPILKDATKGGELVQNLQGLERYERAYMKEAVGIFLQLPAAPNRIGQFKSGPAKDRYFNYRKQRASKSYTVILANNTKVAAYVTDKATGDGSTQTVLKNSLSFCVPRTIKVSEMMAWLANPDIIGQMDGYQQTLVPTASGGESVPYDKIIALITPDDRKHPIRIVTSQDAQVGEVSDLPATVIEQISSEVTP